MATAWAVMHHLGVDGYRDLTRTVIDTTRRMVAGVRAIPELQVLGEPEAHIVAIAAASGGEDGVDVFAVGDALAAKGWALDRQHRPDSLHATVSAGNAPTIEEFLADLRDAVEQVAGTRTDDRSTDYATLE
jgi:glutamate/tyrosine decarboxylase-like PLP-dependent enzyme